jgi:SAM-dependent methyltransferase
MGERKKILHVGCGGKRENALPEPFNTPEWDEIRLDLNPAVEPDYLADICDMPVVPSDSMDGIYSSHNIEHLYPHDVPRALAEFNRVLRDGGIVVMALPDMQRVAQFVAVGNLEEPLYISPAGPICAIDIMYGHRPSMAGGNLFMAHKTAFTATSLARELMAAGFSDVNIVRQGFDLSAFARKLAVLSQPRNHFKLADKGGPAPKATTA